MKYHPFKEIELRLHTDFTEQDIRKVISKKPRVKIFNCEILKQSLDARKKNQMFIGCCGFVCFPES